MSIKAFQRTLDKLAPLNERVGHPNEVACNSLRRSSAIRGRRIVGG